MHKCRPLVKLLMVELGKNKLGKMLEEYDAFIPAKELFKLFLVFLESRLCVIIAV